MAKLPYGYALDKEGTIMIKRSETDIIKMIFQSYLSGDSLGKITEVLSERQVLSPSGKNAWTRSSLDKLLSNSKYIHHIVSIEQFIEVQMEKSNRSNINSDTGKRKAARYNSQNVLSGLLVCAECGANYRRLTKSDGEVIWRCANRVEHGRRICKSSPTVTDNEVKDFICETLGIPAFEDSVVKQSINEITVSVGGTLSAEFKDEHAYEMALQL